MYLMIKEATLLTDLLGNEKTKSDAPLQRRHLRETRSRSWSESVGLQPTVYILCKALRDHQLEKKIDIIKGTTLSSAYQSKLFRSYHKFKHKS